MQKNLVEYKIGKPLFFLSLVTCLMLHLYLPFVKCTVTKHIVSIAYAADEPFVNPTNWGGTGLIEIPTARVMKINNFRAGISQADPYRWYYMAISPIDGFEMDGRITEILHYVDPSLGPSGYGNVKDKSMDFKYQFIKESKYLPALSLGIFDPQGTRKYASQFIVASKQIYPFDFTLGFGNGRYGKSPLSASDESYKVEMITNPKSWLKDGQFFGGVQFSISDQYAIMAEYSPIRYEKQTPDPAQAKYFRRHVPSKFNYAFRWSPYKWTNIIMSYQRGEQIGLNVSVAFDIGQTLLPIFDPPYKEKKKDKENPLSERLVKALYESGFSNIGVSIEGRDIIIEAQNDKYFYTTRAIGVILKILNDIAPENTGRVDIILTSNGIPILKYTTTKIDIDEFYAEKLKTNEFSYLSKLRTDISWTPDVALKHIKYYDFGVNPAFQQFLNDPSGFYKYRLGAYAWMSYFPWRGGTITGGLEGYPINNIKSSVEPSADPVRSDLWLYMKKSVTLGRLMFNQMFKADHDIYTRLAGGLLEIQYAGFDGEIARPFLNGRLYMGISGSLVRKRDVDNPFKLSPDYTQWYKTAFFNTRFNVPEAEMSFDFKTGRFLAGDKGTRLTISKFINGIVFSVWYTWTNTTSVFKDPYNKGYHDKGIALTLPLRLFTGYDTKTTYGYAISPWTRDVAQDIYHYSTLFDFFGRNTKIFLDKDRPMIYK